MIVFKEFRFEAAHWLPGVPPQHKCSRMHGHSYLVRVEVSGDVDGTTGMVIDYDIIRALFDQLVHSQLDHRVLNEIEGLENSTSENLAMWIFRRLDLATPPYVHLRAVEVRETHTAGARVERP
jgi:6-pyruvoyltetrahydropterin/6-carboxytetrahydropterin synthase